MICASITATDTKSAIAEMDEAARDADIIEVRFDYIRDPDPSAFVRRRVKPLIATNRSVRDKGKCTAPERDRLGLLTRAAQAGFDYVDVELDSITAFKRAGTAKVIVSHHDFERTPPDLASMHRRLSEAGADVVKLAVFANDIRDNLAVFDLLRGTGIPTIALCMGELGQISRILAPKFGGFLTYGSVAAGKEAAPGQLTVRDLRRLYRLPQMTADTKIYGVIANPVAHSMSPAIHNAAFDDRKLNAVYLPFKVEDVVEFIEEFKRLDVQGYSVTIPHKQAAIQAMDSVDDFVRDIGALNTVVNRDGKLLGYNTDCLAAISSLEAAMGGDETCLNGKRVVMLGAGGAARAIAFGLKSRGARLTILNRTVERGRRLAEEVGCKWGGLDQLPLLKMDVLINTTSVGMHPNTDATPAPADVLREGMVVFDIVYNPIETRLLREARERGCITVDGVRMFVDQAAAQFRLWTGMPAAVALMRQVVEAKLSEKD